jgi:hypothetical protein
LIDGGSVRILRTNSHDSYSVSDAFLIWNDDCHCEVREEIVGFTMPDFNEDFETEDVSRRRFFGVATGAIAGAVVSGVATGVIVHAVDEHSTQQAEAEEAVKKAYSEGMAAGRKSVLDQISQVNGVSVKSAVQASHTTQKATTSIAYPAAQMLVQIAGNALSDALSTIISAVSTAKNLIGFISDVADLLGHLESLLKGWQESVDVFISLADVAVDVLDGSSIFLDGLDLFIDAALLADASDPKAPTSNTVGA